MPVIVYDCDRKACGPLCPNDECDKTTDVNHRANDKMYTFKKHSMNWEEITKNGNERSN
jgi:hypothetical protein